MIEEYYEDGSKLTFSSLSQMEEKRNSYPKRIKELLEKAEEYDIYTYLAVGHEFDNEMMGMLPAERRWDPTEDGKIFKCRYKGKIGYKHGPNGVLYFGDNGKQKAEEDLDYYILNWKKRYYAVYEKGDIKILEIYDPRRPDNSSGVDCETVTVVKKVSAGINDNIIK